MVKDSLETNLKFYSLVYDVSLHSGSFVNNEPNISSYLSNLDDNFIDRP